MKMISWKAVEYVAPTVAKLNDVGDVNISSPSNDDILTYSDGNWINAPKSTTIVIQVEQSDWEFNSTVN